MDCNRRARIDLHVHSTASDGSLSPTEILSLADQIGLGALAITDHDTIDGVVAALAAGIPEGLQFVPGLEISASRPASFSGPGSFHLLGYGIRTDDPALNQTLYKLQNARAQRNPKIVDRLERLGMALDDQTLAACVGQGGQIGRPHIAAAMVQKGYADTIDDAFALFLGVGKPAYVDKYRVDCGCAIRRIIDAGGLPVLAHPGLLKIGSPARFSSLIAELTAMGLKGIEAYYPEHSPSQTDYFLDTARRHGLIVTGGTDFHGAAKPEIRLGCATGDFSVPVAVFDGLMTALDRTAE